MTPEPGKLLPMRPRWVCIWLVLCMAIPLGAVEWPEPVSNVSEEPYRYVGLIYDSKIYATGFVAVDERLVFSGAHVFTDEWGTMEPADNFHFIRQFHQSDGPTSQGHTIRAAVIYTGANGYAALIAEYGMESPEPFSQDIGVAFGYHPMSDGGAMTLLEDGAGQLKSTVPKKLIGYPIGMYRDRIHSSTSPDQFKVHETRSSTTRFEQVYAGDDRLLEDEQDSLDNTALVSVPGNSGGPIMVETSPGNWAAAGILVAGYSEIPLTYDSSSRLYAGTAVIRAVLPEDWAGLIEPALIEAIGKPVFDTQPVDTTILPGQSGQLHGHAEGYGDITYQWFKNDQVFAGKTNPWLSFDSAQPPQGGTYELRATNQFGTTRSAPAVLTVPTGPAITRQPKDVRLPLGATATISFEFYAAGPYEIKFYRNGSELPPWLNVPEYHIWSEGEYHATVTNKWGQVRTETITAELYLDDGFITMQPQDRSIEVGMPAPIGLRTRTDDVRIQWYKDGVIMPGQIGRFLALSVTKPSDEGNYHATIETNLGRLTSQVARLTVEVGPPIGWSQGGTITARTGVPVRIPLEVHGSQPMTYAWSRDDRPIDGANQPYLDLPSLGSDDFGDYFVLVANLQGSSTFGPFTLAPGLHSFWSQLLLEHRPVITSMACSPETLVLVTEAGVALATQDGNHWEKTAIARGARIADLIWTGEKFVGVGPGITAFSTDGTHWTAQPHGRHLSKVASGSDRLVAIDPTYGLFSSTDGREWIPAVAASDNKHPFQALVWGAAGFLAIDGQRSLVSPDGLIWTESLWPPASTGLTGLQNVSHLTSGNGRYLALVGDGHLLSSSNGASWKIDINGQSNEQNLVGLAVSGDLGAIGSDGSLEWISRDGISWEKAQISVPRNQLPVLIWDGRIVLQGQSGDTYLSSRLDQPIIITAQPVGTIAARDSEATLRVGALFNHNLDIQWYEGESGDTGSPIEGAVANSVTVQVDGSKPIWVRLIRDGYTWDSETVWVRTRQAGVYSVIGTDYGASIAIDEHGRANLVHFDTRDRTILVLPVGTVDSTGKARFEGTSYRALENRLRSELRQLTGRLTGPSVRMNINLAGKSRTLIMEDSQTGATEHLAAGFYRLGLVGEPYSEGAIIVDLAGQAVVAMHTTDRLVSGSMILSSDGHGSMAIASGGTLELRFNASEGRVSGFLNTDSLSTTVSGLRKGTESGSHLGNLSCRGYSQPGSGTLIAGLVTEGVGDSSLIIRGIGPGLAQFGIPDPLPNPELKIITNNRVVKTNSDWTKTTDEVEQYTIYAFHLTSGAFEPVQGDTVLVYRPVAGPFTVHVSSGDGQGGTTLAEVYHLGEDFGYSSLPRLTNLSIRGVVGKDDKPLIVGFVIRGDRPKQVLVRAVGPSLAHYGLTNHLADPQLTLHDVDGPLAKAPYPVEGLPEDYHRVLDRLTSTVGAFPIMDSEPTISAWLNPGIYTAVVAPATSAGGIALVEIYEIPFDAPAN